MSLFLLAPLCTAGVLALHIWLRLSSPRQSTFTLCILLVGLVVIAVVPFYVPELLNLRPNSRATNAMVEGLNRRLLGPALFAIETVALLVVVGVVEAVLVVISKRRLSPERRATPGQKSDST